MASEPKRVSRLLICLAGGRPGPAVYTAQHYDPDEIIIVYSSTLPSSETNLRAALRDATPRACCIGTHPVHPYRTTETAAVLQDLLARHEGREVAISLSGAPMPMGIAAYQVARDTGISAFYLDTDNEELYDLASATPARLVRLRLSVEAFLRQHGCALDPTHDPDKMREGGHAFEREVWESASGMREGAEGEPFFDDCRYGVAFLIPDAQREIDLFCIRHGVALIASCKTGVRAFKKEHLDIVNAVAEKLGARYCTRLYLVGEPRPEPSQRHKDAFELFLQQAHSASTVVITRAGSGFRVQRPAGMEPARDCESLPAILRREMLDPTYPRR